VEVLEGPRMLGGFVVEAGRALIVNIDHDRVGWTDQRQGQRNLSLRIQSLSDSTYHSQPAKRRPSSRELVSTHREK
jgi:hypothetical protein